MDNYRSFSETEIDTNPFIQFDFWYNKRLTDGAEIPNSVSLGTAFTDGGISVRTVLLKSYNETGFVFFTNFKSKKSRQLTSNPKAALLFYWPESDRQIRIEGSVEKVSEEESGTYFKSRPRESQLAAWASEQSSVIPDRNYLDTRYSFYSRKFNEMPVEKPPFWGGFRLVPIWFEFWQSGDFRLHNRLSYTKRNDIWVIERLAP
jgi:pyridoxamine 5'-phosphate oxidase